MTELFVSNFNLFSSCNEKVKHSDIPFSQVVSCITSDRHVEELTASARIFLASNNRTASDVLKRRDMPAILPNAYFESGRCMTDPHDFRTGHMMFDWDHVPRTDVDALVRNLSAHPAVSLVCRSLSGCGVHALVRVNGASDASFRTSYSRMSDVMELMAGGLPPDPQCNSAARLMVLAHDASAFVRQSAHPVELGAIQAFQNQVSAIDQPDSIRR